MSFIEENDQTEARREHLTRITELIGDPYPTKFIRSRIVAPLTDDTVTAVLDRYIHLAPKTADGERATPEQHLEANTVLNDVTVRIAGRLAVPPRVMGKAAFVHLSDGESRLQIYVRRDETIGRRTDGGEVSGWELFNLLDHGDFIGVEGYLFITKTGELSIHVREIEFLAKSLLPMPDKMHGISDPEIRQRQRYADLIAGSLKVEHEAGELSTREVFRRRSQIISEMRRYLDAHDYIEVETPMLTPIASGAAARPFKTHHNALDIDLYARIAPELYLKRLLVGGFERVYELNRNFRNEGISTRHNPEFTMLEFYAAYMDVNGMMDFCEELLRQSVEKATGGTSVRFEDEEIDFGQPFERLTMREAIVRYLPNEWLDLEESRIDSDWFNDTINCLVINEFIQQTEATERTRRLELSQVLDGGEAEVKSAEILSTYEINEQDYWNIAKQTIQRLSQEEIHCRANESAKIVQNLFEHWAEYRLIQPTFVTDFPKPLSPLSKASPKDPTVAERFELFIAGMECANGFSELNDPVEQEARFKEQQAQRERGDDEAMQMDADYLHALAYGMPPAAGIGIGIDRLVMLLTNRRSIRDVILFPHLRPQTRATTDAEATE